MVQLNPFKWGAKSRQKKKDKLRIAEIDASLKKNRRRQGGAGQRASQLKKERAELDGTAEAKRKAIAERKAARKARIERDQARNRRRGSGVRNRTDKAKKTEEKKKKKSRHTKITTWRDLE